MWVTTTHIVTAKNAKLRSNSTNGNTGRKKNKTKNYTKAPLGINERPLIVFKNVFCNVMFNVSIIID